MLAIAKMGRRNKYYYANLAQASNEASSATPGEPPGMWGGTGAVRIGLLGTVERDAFLAIFDGFLPTHEKLVQNAGAVNRVPGWDLVFTVPKSISILWVAADPEVRNQLRALHARAVAEAIVYLETQVTRAQGEKEKVGLVVAYFEHGSNRAGHPNLHTHALVLNAGVTHAGEWGAIDSRVLYQHKMAAGALYRSELARLLQEELQLPLTRCQQWFELRGFSRTEGKYQELMNFWSRRRQDIEAQHPLTAAQAQTIAYRTRDAKGSVPPRDELFRKWQQDAAQRGFGPRQAARFLQESRTERPLWDAFQEWQVLREARQSVVTHQSHFTRRDVVHALAIASQARGLGSSDVHRLADTFLAHRQVQHLGIVEREERFTFKRLYRLEQSLLVNAERLEGQRGIRLSSRQVTTVERYQDLTQEQRRALHQVTARGGIKVLDGLPGTGKTYMLLAAAEAYRKSGYTVVMLSQSGRGAERLKELGGETKSGLFEKRARSITVQKFFAEMDRARQGALLYGLRSRAVAPLTRSTVVFVDQAQLLSTAQMHRLVQEVRREGGKLILAGDVKSRQSYEHSGAFRALCASVTRVRLTQIMRQDTSQGKSLVRAVGEGNRHQVAQALRRDGVLHLFETNDQAQACLLRDWERRAVANPKEALILVEAKEVRAALNARAQERLFLAGVVSERRVKVGDQFFHQGDRVLLQKSSPTYGVTKGSVGTIESLEPISKVAVIRLDSGTPRVLNLRHYKDLSLAYAVGSTEARDMEVRYAFVLSQGAGQDTSLTHVSRATRSTAIYASMPHHERQQRDPHMALSSQMTFKKEHDFSIVLQERLQRSSLERNEER